MANISLTDFVDFVVSSGTPRLTKVRQVKCRGDYDPRFDFWKQLREAIVAYHAPTNVTDKNQFFKNFLTGFTDNPKKLTAYTSAADNYKKFLGKKDIAALPVQRTNWTHNELTVRVNPEIFLNIDGSRQLFKLYFKETPLSKSKIDLMLALLNTALPGTPNVDQYAFFDARHNKTIRSANPNPNLMILLRAEAESFMSMWNEIECPQETETLISENEYGI